MAPHLKRISKLLSLVLRHQPEAIGITLDENGWVTVDELLAKLAAKGHRVDRETLEEVVTTNDKQRFSFSEDGLRIRANQGHSVSVDLELEALTPPDLLYHGTATRNLEAILDQGLQPQARQHVHLSPDEETATKVGMRHGKPVVLHVDAKAMAEAGHAFYRSANGVWLTAAVPPEFLSRPS